MINNVYLVSHVYILCAWIPLITLLFWYLL